MGFATLPKTYAVASILDYHGFDYTMKLDYLWVGWLSKLYHMMDVAKELREDYTHLMFIDCADVVVLASPDEVMERFLSFNHPWVYNAEPFIWSPNSFQPEDYPPVPDRPGTGATPNVKYRYLNAGASIGEIEFMDKWLTRWCRPGSSSRGDQDWLAGRFLESYPDAMMLDTNCELFQCMCGSQVGDNPHVALSPGVAHNRITGTYPLIVHFNGGTDITDEKRKPLWQHWLRNQKTG